MCARDILLPCGTLQVACPNRQRLFGCLQLSASYYNKNRILNRLQISIDTLVTERKKSAIWIYDYFCDILSTFHTRSTRYTIFMLCSVLINASRVSCTLFTRNFNRSHCRTVVKTNYCLLLISYSMKVSDFIVIWLKLLECNKTKT